MDVTKADDQGQLALRHAFDRARAAEWEATTYARRWQEAVRDCEAAQTRLAAIESSYVYRVLRSLARRLAPAGSLRRRFCAANSRGVQRLCRGARSCVESLGVVRPPRSESNVISASVQDARTPLTDVSQAPSSDCSTAAAPQGLAYQPLSWRLPAASADAAFLDLFVLSPVHRTGSTLLQRICNSRKGTLIWGEQGGVLTQFAAVFVNATAFSALGESEREQYFGQGENPNLWIANMCPEMECVQQALVNSARSFMNTLYGRYRNEHDILGFKEVQYGGAELQLLRRCYPKAQLLLILRDPLHAWKSTPKEWYPSIYAWVRKYNSGVIDYCRFAKTDANCHLIRYEDLIRQESKTMAVLADVARLSRQQIATVLAHKIGAGRGGLSDAERDTILTACRDSMQLLGYGEEKKAGRTVLGR